MSKPDVLHDQAECKLGTWRVRKLEVRACVEEYYPARRSCIVSEHTKNARSGNVDWFSPLFLAMIVCSGDFNPPSPPCRL